jgi:hypothetical protein
MAEAMPFFYERLFAAELEEANNQEAKPFVWKASAQSIIDKVNQCKA